MGKTVQANTAIPQRSFDPDGLLAVSGPQLIEDLPGLYKMVRGHNSAVPRSLRHFTKLYGQAAAEIWDYEPAVSTDIATDIVLSFNQQTTDRLCKLLHQQQQETIAIILPALKEQQSGLNVDAVESRLASGSDHEYSQAFTLMETYSQALSAALTKKYDVGPRGLNSYFGEAVFSLAIDTRANALGGMAATTAPLGFRSDGLAESNLARILALELLRQQLKVSKDPADPNLASSMQAAKDDMNRYLYDKNFQDFTAAIAELAPSGAIGASTGQAA